MAGEWVDFVAGGAAGWGDVVMGPLRKVISSTRVHSKYTIGSAFTIRDMLECGHVSVVKGSQGYAKRRRCIGCLRGWARDF